MFKRELKYNLKSFLIWMSLLLATYLVVFLIYPSIANSESISSLDEMMAVFPKELLEALNMDVTSITTVYGWLKSEGFVTILLIIGCYSGILGSNILLKEESDKTIEYLNSLPIKRSSIVFNKFLVGLIYIVSMVLIIGIFNYIGLSITGDFDQKQYILLSMTPMMPSIVIYSVSMFLSTFFHKTKKMLGISLGVVFLSYVLNILSGLDESVEALKYISIYTLADVRNVLVNTNLNFVVILISILITILFLIFTKIRFEKKDLIA